MAEYNYLHTYLFITKLQIYLNDKNKTATLYFINNEKTRTVK